MSDGLVCQVPFDNEDEEGINNIKDWDYYEGLQCILEFEIVFLTHMNLAASTRGGG